MALSSARMSGEISRPRITKRGIALVLGMWGIYTLLDVVPHALKPHPIPFLDVFFWETCHSTVKFATGIPVWFIVIKWMYKKTWHWKVLAHLILLPMYGIVNTAYQYYLEAWLKTRLYNGPVSNVMSWILYFNLLTYIIQFAVYHLQLANTGHIIWQISGGCYEKATSVSCCFISAADRLRFSTSPG